MSRGRPAVRRAASGLLLLPALLASATGLAAGPPAPPADRARLEQGEILVTSRPVAGSKVPEVTALALVDGPPEAVWSIIDRCGEYKAFMPRVEASRELERHGERVVCRIEIDLPFPLPTLWSVSEAEHRALPDRRFERRWQMREGSYEVNSGAWEISPWGDEGKRSLVSYRVQALPKMILPDSLLSSFQQRGLPDVMRALRSRVAHLPAPSAAAGAPAAASPGAGRGSSPGSP